LTFGPCPLSITVTDVHHVPAGSLCPTPCRPCCEPVPLVENGSIVTFRDRYEFVSVGVSGGTGGQGQASPGQGSTANKRHGLPRGVGALGVSG
jgi:hypothetical protein